jgi:hypothetical protein
MFSVEAVRRWLLPRLESRAAPLIGKLLRRADLTRYASKCAAHSKT